eukprot:Awhi_evm1s12211
MKYGFISFATIVVAAYSANASISDLTVESNMAGDSRVLCQLVQKTSDREEEMSLTDAQDLCENQIAPFFKQSSYGKYNILCETRIVEFSYSFKDFE